MSGKLAPLRPSHLVMYIVIDSQIARMIREAVAPLAYCSSDEGSDILLRSNV